jgi:hypothetical protein
MTPLPRGERTKLMANDYGPLKVPSVGDIDFLALGASFIASTRSDPFRKAMTCAIHVSGGEFNTAANLADCFGCRPASPARWSTTRSAS